MTNYLSEAIVCRLLPGNNPYVKVEIVRNSKEIKISIHTGRFQNNDNL